MAVTSNRSVTIQFSSDVEYTQKFDALPSSVSPGDNSNYDLSTGNNTISVPDDCVAVTIIPPADNEVVLTLKGVNGDTGIALSLTDPSSIGLNNISSFVLNVSVNVTLRIIFS